MPKTSMITTRPLRAGLTALAQRFKTWRSERRRGQRIPEELWQAATEQAQIHGLNPTVATLGLNYYDLQRRMQGSRAPRRGRPPAPTFVELPAAALTPGGAEPGTVELIQAGGARLILRIGAADLLPLVQAFLRGGA